MKSYKLTLEPLTVLHVGTGYTVEPHEYLVTEGKTSPLYLRIDFDHLFDNLHDPQMEAKLIKVLTQSKDFIEIRKQLQKEFPRLLESHCIYGSHVTDEFTREFNSKIDEPNNLLAVQETYRPPRSKVPYIPGSSIKGALRTALLNRKANSLAEIQRKNIAYTVSKIWIRKIDHEFQQALLGYTDAKEDPFRTLCISDGKVQGNRPMLVGIAYNFSLKNGIPRDSTIPIFLEVIRGSLSEGNATIKVHLFIHSELVSKSKNYSIHKHPKERFNGIPFEIKLEDIILSCNTFYKKVWAEEFEKFYEQNANRTQFDTWDALNQEISSIGNKPNEFLLRIGRFSHFEAVTVEKFRRAPKGYGKSRTLFSYNNSLLPMGWVKVTVEGD